MDSRRGRHTCWRQRWSADHRFTTGADSTPLGKQDIFDLTVGTCYSDELFDDSTSDTVNVVECDEPHLYEVYALVDLPEGDALPDDLARLANQGVRGELPRLLRLLG